MSDHEDEWDDHAGEEESEIEVMPSPLGGTIGSALGGAMAGLDMALGRQPPGQVLASEHMPERGSSGSDDDLVIEFPDAIPPAREPRSGDRSDD